MNVLLENIYLSFFYKGVGGYPSQLKFFSLLFLFVCNDPPALLGKVPGCHPASTFGPASPV